MKLELLSLIHLHIMTLAGFHLERKLPPESSASPSEILIINQINEMEFEINYLFRHCTLYYTNNFMSLQSVTTVSILINSIEVDWLIPPKIWGEGCL